MINISIKRLSIGAAVLSLILSVPAFAAKIFDKNLPYPSGDLTAEQIAEQVYFVNQFHAYHRYSIEKDGRTITVIINRSKGSKPTTLTVERFKNNEYTDGSVRSKEVAIFRSGKLRGTGMLIVDFEDDAKPQAYSIWLPALRKIRRFAEPPHDDAWGGTDFTFGDVILRKPFHETHELLGKETFNECLEAMEVPDNQRTRYMKSLPEPSCAPKGKEVYKLKSTTKFPNWWYDYRISYVDTKSFADYRTEYFKDGNKIKLLDRDWKTLGKDDPRELSWGYWYARDLNTGHETWAVIPQDVVRYNTTDKNAKFWTESTLRKIKR
jgi:Outer membrane lipoprotein-sorting protein